MPSPRHAILSLRAAAVLLLGFGVPALASTLVIAVSRPEILDLSEGHAGGWLGAVGTLLAAANNSLMIGAAPHYLALAAGLALLLLKPAHVLAIARRLDRK